MDSRGYFDLILDVTTEGHWDWNLKNDRAYLSPRYCELVGYSPDDTVFDSHFFKTIIHPDDRDHVFKIIEEHLRGKSETSVLEYRMVSKNGTIRWIEGRGKIVEYDEQGVPARMVGTITDITKRKHSEELLEESQELLFNLTYLVPGVVYQYQLYPDGRSAFPYSSQGMNDIYEVTPEEVREDATPVFGRLHPDDYDHVSSLIMESARTLQTFFCEFRVILPRQGLRWRWSQAQPKRMSDGGTLWHGIISDITDRKNAEENEVLLQNQLQQAQKMESIGRLAGGVAHDFNNMLTIIIGHSELGLSRLDPNHPVRDDFIEIRRTVQRSADLTRQLLAFARKQTIAPKVLDLNETISGMLKMLQRLIGEDINLIWNPELNLWPVKADATQINQVLANLCVNSRDAIPDIGVITISTGNIHTDESYKTPFLEMVPGKYVKFSVSDSGAGMDKETLAHIFEPFYTTKEQGKGTGLGLATVYGAVKQNCGYIDVNSEPGAGTTFTIYLPRHEGKSKQVLNDAEAELVPSGRETILLVEDELAILNIVTMILTKQGYNVLAANTPGEALKISREYSGEINLLMTDVVMPEMNGRDLAKKLLSLYPGIKRLFMSGYTSDVIAHHGVLDEGVHFIQKPFNMNILATKVRETLDSQ
jgi:PAS domain S-box-containing protein